MQTWRYCFVIANTGDNTVVEYVPLCCRIVPIVAMSALTATIAFCSSILNALNRFEFVLVYHKMFCHFIDCSRENTLDMFDALQLSIYLIWCNDVSISEMDFQRRPKGLPPTEKQKSIRVFIRLIGAVDVLVILTEIYSVYPVNQRKWKFNNWNDVWSVVEMWYTEYRKDITNILKCKREWHTKKQKRCKPKENMVYGCRL